MPAHFDFFRRAIAVRSAYPALRRGSIETVLTDDEQDVWVFIRKFEGQEVLVALNAGEADAVVALPPTLGIDWKRVLVEPEQAGASWPTISVPAVGGAVWVNNK
jgi:glycosidase